MTDLEMVRLLRSIGAVAGRDWTLAKAGGRSEIVVSRSGFRLLAEHSPDPAAKAAAIAYLDALDRRDG